MPFSGHALILCVVGLSNQPIPVWIINLAATLTLNAAIDTAVRRARNRYSEQPVYVSRLNPSECCSKNKDY